MSNKVKINIKTYGGAKTLLKDLQEQLKQIHYTQEVQGLKSVYYHRKKVERLITELEQEKPEALAEAEKYFTRGKTQKKLIDIKKDAAGNLIYFRGKELSKAKEPGAGFGSMYIAGGFYDFINNWPKIKEIIEQFIPDGYSLFSMVYGIGDDYQRWKRNLGNAFGIDFSQLLEYIQMAKDVYFNYKGHITALYNTAIQEPDRNNINEINEAIEAIDTLLSDWNHPGAGNARFNINEFYDFAGKAADVGAEIMNSDLYV